MRIAFFVHCFFPSHFYGTETYTLELAKHYQAAGHQVAVVSATFQGEPRQENLIARYEFQGIPVYCIDKNRIPHARVKETYYQPEMRGVLRSVLEELKPDVIHVTHLINHTAALLEVVRELGIPAYATFTDFFGFCLNNKLETASGDLCHGPSDSRSNCVACHLKAAAGSYGAGWMRHASSAGKAQMLASLVVGLRRLPGLRNGQIDGLVEDIVQRPDTLATLYNCTYRAAVAPTRFLGSAYQTNGIKVPLHDIHFGVDIDRRPKPKRDAGHQPVIGFIGQIAPHKGTDLLISAFCRLPEKSAVLHIYGPADQDPDYMRQLEKMAQGAPVEFKGTFGREEMVDILAGIDLLVIPSRWYENSPLVLLNALATHTPVLVADVAGMTEFLEPGVNGYAFARGSAEQLYQRLRDLVHERALLYAMSGTTNYERTPSMMAEETLRVYQSRRMEGIAMNYDLGCNLPADVWADFNRNEVFKRPELARYASPFPPSELMQNTTGLTSNADFASHGADFWLAFSAASPKPLSEYASILDFGCGCGRFARMFKGHRGRIAGCDIDRRHVEWSSSALNFMTTKLSNVYPPIPFEDNEFDAVISISIFTHLNETSQDIFLRELARVCRPGGILFLTVHGARALERALTESAIKAMLDMNEDLFAAARNKFFNNQYAFIMQQGHLTTVKQSPVERLLSNKVISDPFEYGITFIPEDYLRSHWGKWFDLIDYRVGALHDFQDIVVLVPRK